jgi:opacity protein-like surface antigen
MKHSRLTVAMLTLIGTSPALAQAQATTSDQWQFEATPYLWAAGMNGWTRIGARTPTAKIDPSFSDVWRNLDVGAMGSFEARKGRWAAIFDSVYVKLSATSDPLPGGTSTARVGLKEAILQLAGAYRVLDSAVTPVDVLVGARYTYLYGDLSFSPGAIIPGTRSRSNSVNWTDGFVGVRGIYNFMEKWALVGYADAGAGGTKHSWQLLAGVNYNISKMFVARVGYRIISMDYEKTDFLYNVKTSGIFVGVGIRF